MEHEANCFKSRSQNEARTNMDFPPQKNEDVQTNNEFMLNSGSKNSTKNTTIVSDFWDTFGGLLGAAGRLGKVVGTPRGG